MTGSSIDNSQFRRILTRNVALPLGLSVLSAGVFVAIIAYLISVLNWVEHSQQVIGNATEVNRLVSEMETGMRGYLLTGDESFLGPYVVSKPKVEAELESLVRMVNDNDSQTTRLSRVRAAQAEWVQYSNEMIERRRRGEEVIDSVKSGRGKILTDDMRAQFAAFIAMERTLLQTRNEDARSVTTWSVGFYLLFTLIVGGMMAAFGRRELVRLSKSYSDILDHEAEHNAELRHQAWLRTGQTELSARSAGIHSLEPLAQAVLDHGGALCRRQRGRDVRAQRRRRAAPHRRLRLLERRGAQCGHRAGHLAGQPGRQRKPPGHDRQPARRLHEGGVEPGRHRAARSRDCADQQLR